MRSECADGFDGMPRVRHCSPQQPSAPRQTTHDRKTGHKLSAKRMQLRFVYARTTCSTIRALMLFCRKDKADMPYAWRWPS